ncbi:MAG: Hsp20/alpha crystallin family protein [Limnochordales bacterium]|nr:Hsp20/alpha crystallin family protein [Limnochordales bacterium]
MPLIPWINPWEIGRRSEPGRRLARRGWPSWADWFGGLMPDLFADFPMMSDMFRSLQSFPPIDVQETDTAYVISADLPGFDKNQLQLWIDENVLTIKGQQDEIYREERGGYLRQERRTGSFVRHIPLPDDIEPEGIRAEFDKGVLRITVPRTGRSAGSGRRIEIS